MFHSSQASELKAQGVEEAARDPNTNVTSDDAQRKIEQESKKAGIPAFKFDPNATPAEKAAAADAALPAGFHRDKSHGVGVVTDIGGGPDQYDLPSPTTKGAVETPTTPTKEGKANGHMHHEEKESFEKKTGWAPRFGQGDLTEEEANASLLDHTTWVESRLDEKFFGDWYHNAAVIVFACLASWVVAVLGGGLGWIFLVMTACGTYYRTSLRRVRRNFRDDVHREMVKAKLEEDVESLEWINSFLVKFWPIYAPVICQTVINSVDQVLSTSTPAFLDSLRLKFFTLGTKPPRLEHVKTYPRANDEEVVMDWKFSFTPNDTTDMTARQLKNKINPKVVLEVRIGKGVVSKGLDVIVEDMAFSGLMRVRVKLQLPFPHIEKVEICFLGRPDIDYACKPLGGDMLGFDINFIPGLESFIKEQIHANLSPIMYQPNVFPIEIAKMLAGNAVDQAIGVVAVTIYGAQGLKNPDNFSGSPDPYIMASLNGRGSLGRTKTVKETSNPRFNETIYVIVTSLTDTLNLQVFDYNEFRKDKDLGTAAFALEQCQEVTDHENLQLEVLASGNKHRGVVQADIRFFSVLEGLKLENGQMQPPPESNTGIARFTVEQAKDLDGSKSLVGQLSPYAILLLNGKEIHKTDERKRTNQPIWTDNSKEFLVTDRKNARLGVVIKDDRDLGSNPIVGTYQIKLDDLMSMMEQGKEWFNLSGVNTGRVKLMLNWKPVGLRDVFGAGDGYMTPIGVMRLHFQNARDLRNVEAMGKSDPYVRVLLSGIEKGKTVTFQNNLNPDWDEVIYVPVHTPRERLTLEVMDYQNIGKDRSLGLIELAAADFVKQGENGEYLVDDEKKLHKAPLRMLGKGTPKGVLNFTAAFYPTIPVLDPEDEEAEKKDLEESTKTGHSRTSSRNTVGRPRTTSKSSVATGGRKSLEFQDAVDTPKEKDAGKIDTSLSAQLDQAEKEQKEQQGERDVEEIPKIKLTADDLTRYESGLLVFRLISAELCRSNLTLEVLMDDMAFPSYSSSKARSRKFEFGETGDAMVREIDLSRITVRLVEKVDKKGDGDDKDVVAKLSGDLLPVLQRCLYTESELTIGSGSDTSKVKVLMKYLPIKMRLDPSESMNNMGSLRVDVLDATELPSADRNGYSDPFCKFELNGQSVHKTKVQKKTLHPAWNEFFEVPIPSRTAAKFHVKVMDWDFGDRADFLGEADINLEILEPMQSQEVTLVLNGSKGPGTAGAIRLRLLFKASYVTRTRQGSSTFSGTIGPAGKVIGAPVKGVGKVGSTVGGGLVKGASFMRHGFRSSKEGKTPTDDEQTNGLASPGPDMPLPSVEGPGPGPSRAAALPVEDEKTLPATPRSETPHTPQHARSPSAKSATIAGSPTPGRGDSGTAEISVLSASGYPAGTKVQVLIKQLPSSAIGAKGHAKELLKTKPLKASSPEAAVAWEGKDVEVLKHSCTADTQFQIQVRNHGMFGGGDDLGEALFFVDDSASGAGGAGGGAGSERSVTVGTGEVKLRSRFVLADQASNASGPSWRGKRRSLLSKREPGAPGGSRQGTPS